MLLFWCLFCAAILFTQIVTEIKKQEQIFDQTSANLHQLIRQRLAQNEAVLGGLDALFNTFDGLKFDGVRGYSKDMLSRYPHIYTIGLQPLVEFHNLTKFENEARKTIHAHYQIRDFGLDAERTWKKASNRPFYYPVTFMEPPVESASHVMGLDVYADPKIKAAIDESIQTKRFASSAPFNLVEGGRGYILFKALFNTASPSPNLNVRQSQATRLVSLLISAEKLLSREELPPSDIAMSLYHRQYSANDKNGQIYLLNKPTALPFANFLLPDFTFKRQIQSDSQPFVFETNRQIGWEIFSASKTFWIALITLFITLLFSATINLRRIAREETRVANELLFQAKDRALVTLQSINDAVVTLTEEGNIGYVNPAAELALQQNFDEIEGKKISDVLDLHFELSTAQIVDPFAKCIQNKLATDLPENTVLLDSSGQKKLIEGSISPLFSSDKKFIGAVFVFRDMGPVRKKAMEAIEASEKRLRQHQSELAHVARINTMGEMAAGIAHEINQPLAAILSYNQACIRMLQSDESNVSDIIQAMKSAAAQSKRAGEIIKRLREFVSKNASRSSLVDLNQVIHNVLALSEHQLRDAQVTLQTSLESSLPSVIADAIQMEQVILNLIRNAIDVMKDNDSENKTIHLITKSINDRVEVAVQDTGTGISNEVIDHLFTPFFSTKKDGMGLGLTISYSIVEAYGGTLIAKNLQPSGAEFSFSLAVSSVGTATNLAEEEKYA